MPDGPLPMTATRSTNPILQTSPSEDAAGGRLADLAAHLEVVLEVAAAVGDQALRRCSVGVRRGRQFSAEMTGVAELEEQLGAAEHVVERQPVGGAGESRLDPRRAVGLILLGA